MRIGAAGRVGAAIVATVVLAAAWSGLTAAAAAAAGGPGMFARLPRWTRSGEGRTASGPWGWGWRDGGAPPAPTLSGDWAPFNRCPVDNPTMLAADGVNEIAACMAMQSPSGAIKIGNLSLATGESSSQFGLILKNEESEQTYKLVVPPGGATQMTPLEIPDGLAAMICPVAPWELPSLCGSHHGHGYPASQLADITATVEQAGELSNFTLFSMFETGVPFITEPVRIHLQNALLGPRCYIGSEGEPIVLQLERLTPFTTLYLETFEADGTPLTEGEGPMLRLGAGGGNVGDQSFAVPGVNGCGPRGSLDGVIDEAAGLPSPAGSNSLVLDEVAGYVLAVSEPETPAGEDGKRLSQYWHSAIVGGPHGHWGH